jgi:pre-rRNA-processing protein TSR3
MEAEILILRDPRESQRKCSLTSLRGSPGIQFVEYHPERTLEAGGRILLQPEAPVLREDDGLWESGHRGLLLLDCAWRRVDQLLATVRGEFLPRSLPPLVTAYPRRSRVFQDPLRGLASVEALYAAQAILGRQRGDLLTEYRWAGAFLDLNPGLAPPDLGPETGTGRG